MYQFVFLSTPSARRATIGRTTYYRKELISIHALREEGDCSFSLLCATISKFLSTPSARRATFGVGAERLNKIISIHALREEGDSSVPGLAR